jgi:hypothetical protein
MVASAQDRVVTWGKIFGMFKRKKVSGGARDGSACILAPRFPHELSNQPQQFAIPVIWNANPLFAWKGYLGKSTHLEVQQRSTDSLLWNSSLRPDDMSLIYQGKSLQPGQIYEWRLSSDGDPNSRFSSFYIMDSPERDVIKADLDRLEAQLTAQKATTEMIALNRANYFAEQGLWADVEREAMIVENRSPELTHFIQALSDQFCGVAK